MSLDINATTMRDRLPSADSALPFRARPCVWLGAATALATLMLRDATLQTGAKGLLLVAALATTKEIVWDFVICGDEEPTLDTDTTHATAAFAATYLLGLFAAGA